ncbi:hypothetical protein [Hymenobacter terrenus]|uniref:hypothetical protein n=1 Tax=Hymenobacter terrenus TaxID=1629124 RepID=UPI0012E020E8|nr:hypothetical protein [Hymenobacter terrenus]
MKFFLRACLATSGWFLLAECEPTTRTSDSTESAPSVLATARYAVQLLTAAPPVHAGPTFTYAGRSARYEAEFQRYVLELPGYEFTARTDTTGALTEAVIFPLPPSLALDSTAAIHIDPTRPADTLAVSLAELRQAFGPWKGDFFTPQESTPAPHRTVFTYRNPTTGRVARLDVFLRSSPSAPRNSVLSIYSSVVHE